MDVHIERVRTIAVAVRAAFEKCEPKSCRGKLFPRRTGGDVSLVSQILHIEGIGVFMYVCGHKYRDSDAASSHAWLQNRG